MVNVQHNHVSVLVYELCSLVKVIKSKENTFEYFPT